MPFLPPNQQRQSTEGSAQCRDTISVPHLPIVPSVVTRPSNVSNVNLAVKHVGEVHGKLVPENVRHRTAVEHHLDKQQQSMRVSGQLRMSAVTAALPALAAVCCGST